MTISLSINWWQMCLLVVATVGALLYWIDKNSCPGSYLPDIGAMMMELLVVVSGIAMIVGIIVGKFVFGG